MQLTVKLRKRWITSVLKEADAAAHPMPWHRAKRRKPIQAGIAVPRSKPQLVQV